MLKADHTPCSNLHTMFKATAENNFATTKICLITKPRFRQFNNLKNLFNNNAAISTIGQFKKICLITTPRIRQFYNFKYLFNNNTAILTISKLNDFNSKRLMAEISFSLNERLFRCCCKLLLHHFPHFRKHLKHLFC